MKNMFLKKDEKISDRFFMKSLVVSVVSILICIATLCSVTYAWFSKDVLSESNKLKSGHFNASVVLLIADGGEHDSSSDLAVSPDDSGVYTLDPGTYVVTIEPTDESTVKGYCILKSGGEKYYTDVIVNENTVNEIYSTSTSPFVFYIEATEVTTFRISSEWGIPATVNVTNGDIISLTPTAS